MYAFLKKKYGQNFLIDKNILNKIKSLILRKKLNVIEIGPGDGRLTDYIIETQPSELVLVEIDKVLIPQLRSKYLDKKNIHVLNKDILKFKISRNVDLIISNLPYNISSQILVKICSSVNLPENLILMFQKEFADRLLETKLNAINSLVCCFYDIKKKFDVSKNSFRPIPKVDSSVLIFTKKKEVLLKYDEIKNFIIFKRKLFSHKRKLLRYILKSYQKPIEDFFLNKRVEDLNINQLLEIFRKVNL